MELENKKPPLSVYKKMLAIQRAVIGLGKDKQGHGYEYVTGNKVLGEIKPLMNSLGLLLICNIPYAEYREVEYYVNRSRWEGGNEIKYKEDKKEILVVAKFIFTWICVETGEELSVDWSASGFNQWDKGIGSAMTYAERYFLMKTFHIATDEDDVDNPFLRKEEEKRLKSIEKEINTTYTEKGLVTIFNRLSPEDKTFFKDALTEQKNNIKNIK